ncbi:RES family NAD+ phosphorylase [Pseudomonas sp. LS44]|uniref:RES family NAD+ phosphorylase n=1 Tax=Pseudomonas sp. LS44 TaxID=1357074 RepID=UPI00215B485E|nr:RES family NAD+ phosphorylase [Pseudomonas sp. LS44]UVE19419.1 RES family NAD+ phosphorylase [Pseudomonas sp. LS44]
MHRDDIARLNAKRICHECIGEEYLSNEVSVTGEAAKCSYCDQTMVAWSLGQLAKRVEIAFDHHFTRTSVEPDYLQRHMMADRESSYEWFREGDTTVEAFEGAAEVASEVAKDVQVILEDKHACYDPSEWDGETEFSAECHYEEKGATDEAWQEDWRNFEQCIQKEARFFSRSAAVHLAEVFGHIDSLKTSNNQPLVVDAGPYFDLNCLYRARVFQSEDPLLKALCRPDQELGPPPARLATAGRMNAQGISVFYGATSMQSAIAEVRPPVGSRVVVARFNIQRPLRLLDLTALEYAHDTGSIFDLTLKDRLERVAFLRSVGKRMTRAVMPDDQALDYLATQAIADFLATENEPALDGIIFQSAQAKEGRNVVLFHKASKVEAMSIPQNTEISASAGHHSDEGYEVDYSVWETVTKAIKDDALGHRQHLDPDNLLWFDPADVRSLEPREATLSVDLGSVEVHSVDWVQVHCTAFSVSRHRYEQSTSKVNDF